ncbi:MAG TPA: hypothetical protein VKE40_28325 [Gemmataceae bacterium]|nr:hypothetical protein [Gemmataceae bacterium]
MSGSSDSLTPRQHAAIAALLTERNHAKAAKKAKVAEQTLRRWLATDRAFVAAYRDTRRTVMDAVIGNLQQTAAKAVAALERNLTCGRPGDEIRAALGVLVHASRGLEVGDLLERVEELERLLMKEEADATQA